MIPMECATHGQWNPAKESGCPHCTRQMRIALRKIQQWDMLNPPRPEMCADLPWLKRLVDEALGCSVPQHGVKP
jgi:hypothetical protein